MTKMNPEDVMRALEVCVEGVCDACPYNEKPGCLDDMMMDALALLRENDAEIERLKLEYAGFEGATKQIIEMLKAENATYANGVEKVAENYHKLGRAEAITEFEERLKTFYKHLPGGTVGGSVNYHIEQIAKEMREKQ